jgi:hypothetical protein
MKQPLRPTQPARVLNTGHDVDVAADYPDKLSQKIWDQANRRPRAKPDQDRAWRALSSLFLREDGILDTFGYQPTEMLTKVNKWLKDQDEKPVKIDTVLRVLGHK